MLGNKEGHLCDQYNVPIAGCRIYTLCALQALPRFVIIYISAPKTQGLAELLPLSAATQPHK